MEELDDIYRERRGHGGRRGRDVKDAKHPQDVEETGRDRHNVEEQIART